jgi:hypothetical protein
MLIGLHGFADSGKDATADFLIADHGFVKVDVFDPGRAMGYLLDPIVARGTGVTGVVRYREVCDAIGYDQMKTEFPESREFLQRLGDALRSELGEDVLVEAWLARAVRLERAVATSIRHRNEAEALRTAGGFVVVIDRPGVGPVNDHITDRRLPPELIDRHLLNDGTLDDLREKAGELIATLPGG